MIEIVPYRPEHLARLLNEPDVNVFFGAVDTPGYAEALEKVGPAFTALAGARVLACGGIREEWAGRGTAWALLSGRVGAQMVVLHRAARRVLALGRFRRVEAAVVDGYAPGCRWLDLLGFRLEVPRALNYMPDGKSARLYVWTGGAPCS